MLINSSSPTGIITLNTPEYLSTLSLFGSTGGGTNTVNYTLHFAGGSTQTGSLTFPDWFNNSPVAIAASGRVNENGFDSVGGGNPNVYQENIAFTYTGLALDSISFSDAAGGGGNTAIMALSGTFLGEVPEPSSVVALCGLGAMGLFFVARRRRKS